MLRRALVITTDGTKVPVGLWLGDTENKTVVTSLLSDLVARGLCYEKGGLCVIDGAKALAAGIEKVFGESARVQRCTLHKRRNVSDHLPKELGRMIDRKLAVIFAQPDADKGLDAPPGASHPSSRGTTQTRRPRFAKDSQTCSPPGASESRPPSPRNLTNTNCIESMISVARRTTRRVTRWKDGSMKKRWLAAGMLEAERSFRRIKGYTAIPAFVDALRREIHPTGAGALDYDHQAA